MTVHAELPTEVLFPDRDEPDMAITVELAWTERDPLAIRLTMRNGEEPCDWYLSRDLLAAGLIKPVWPVAGDVRIRPNPQDPTRLEVWLSSNKRAVLVMDRVAVQLFVERTWVLFSPERPVLVPDTFDAFLAATDGAP